jgi:hypothetical protein
MPSNCHICNGAVIEVGTHPSGRPLGLIRCVACGGYFFTSEAFQVIKSLSDEERFALSAATRMASDAGKPVEMLAKDVRELVAGAPKNATLSDAIDRLLLLLGRRATGSYLAPISVRLAPVPTRLARRERRVTALAPLRAIPAVASGAAAAPGKPLSDRPAIRAGGLATS